MQVELNLTPARRQLLNSMLQQSGVEGAESLTDGAAIQALTANLSYFKPLETRPAFVVMSNSDLTEGKGHSVVLHITELKSTATRLAKGKGVQGTDADVQPVELIRYRQFWMGPITVLAPSSEDKRLQEDHDRKMAVVKKAMAAGITREDLALVGVRDFPPMTGT